MIIENADIINAYQAFDFKKVVNLASEKVNILKEKTTLKGSTSVDKFNYLDVVLRAADASRLTGQIPTAEQQMAQALINITKNDNDAEIIDSYMDRFSVLHAQITFDKSLFEAAFYKFKTYLENKFGADFLSCADTQVIERFRHWDLKALTLYGLSAIHLNDFFLVKEIHQASVFMLGYFRSALILENDSRNIYKDFVLDTLYLYALWMLKIKNYSNAYDDIKKLCLILDIKYTHLNIEQYSFMHYIDGISTNFLTKKEIYLKQALVTYTDTILVNVRQNSLLLKYLHLVYKNRLELGSVEKALLDSLEDELMGYSIDAMHTDQDYINEICILRPFIMI